MSDEVWIQPDLARGYGWVVYVGYHSEYWCWTKWGANRLSDRLRAERKP